MALVKDLLNSRVAHTFVGRTEELALLLQTLEPDGPLVVHLHGIAGSGKSTLLDVFAQQARAAGATVVRFDCRSIEPTEAGLLSELAAATGGTSGTPEEIAIRLGQVGTQVLVVLDTYEVFRLMDSWLRQLPAGTDCSKRSGWIVSMHAARWNTFPALVSHQKTRRAWKGCVEAPTLRIARRDRYWKPRASCVA